MPWNDPIVEEVRKARDAYAKRFNYDLDAIFRDLKDKERKSGKTIVPCPAMPTSAPTTGEVQNEEIA